MAKTIPASHCYTVPLVSCFRPRASMQKLSRYLGGRSRSRKRCLCTIIPTRRLGLYRSGYLLEQRANIPKLSSSPAGDRDRRKGARDASSKALPRGTITSPLRSCTEANLETPRPDIGGPSRLANRRLASIIPTLRGRTAILPFASGSGKYAEAEAVYRQAIEIGEKAFGKDHPDVAIWYNNLAGLLQ